MDADFDIVIVGSGPAGVSAAFPLVEAGLRVLMVDGGEQTNIAPPMQSFLDARIQDKEQWKWMIGEDFHALQMREAVSPKLRAPAHEFVFRNFSTLNRVEGRDFAAIGSLAPGGLSNAWGCGVARLSDAELAQFPFPSSDIFKSYKVVARRIGVSGANDDDLSEYFGLDPWAQPPIALDAAHQSLYANYTKQRKKLAPLGFRLGRSRVAVLSDEHAGRKACNNSSNCLWGCARRALYNAADEIAMLRQFENFQYESGLVVGDIQRVGKHWSVCGIQKEGNVCRSATGRKILLAAGTLATTRLALRLLKSSNPVRLLSCPTAAFLLWMPRMFGAARTSGFGLGQLSFSLAIQDTISGFGSTFATTGIPVAEFACHLPLRRRYGVDLLKNLLSSCLVGNLFLPGHLSNNKAVLNEDGSLHLEGAYSESVSGLLGDAAARLRKAYWQLGAFLLPMSFTVGRPGGDIHYAGTLPMRKKPDSGETDLMGALYGFSGVHIVDGACLPALSEKSHTLTVMANADRIARALALQWHGIQK
ncbi:FAD-dependent oxidoreductase [Noviherbaspirillum sp. UKPF54]|uniref:FAD-dependent oxidoreductase n=1 Tax=Noviherbaspirillum sp. UKPF54 TaxID=2601898 RepID=UPI0011B0FC27|nr:FAD-dependent oxidoreductase [Noviherbaspirillum sp. UKPF54]QDZ28852.1 GMC family oxidoreductase [Noviherbaspirillum sp. UKPF54]